jgi:hypothetical protein
MQATTLKLAALSLVATSIALGGCSNTDEMDKLRADIQANRDAAARAQASADDADHRSKEALNAANAANARIDRMFKKAMYK